MHTSLNQNKYMAPAETTPHIATILGFPSRCSTFPNLYEPTCNEIIDLAGTIAHFEPVRLHVRPEDQHRAQSLLDKRMATAPPSEKARITLVPVATNHIWVRDTGPVYVRGEDNERYAIDFQFCEWGNKTGELLYNSSADKAAALKIEAESEDWPVMDEEARNENTEFARRVLEIENASNPDRRVERVLSKVRLEGGGIEMDGEGTFMAAESSVLVSSRNEGLSRDEIEAELRRLLGVSTFIWIPGREGLDITDCHIDAEVRFVRPGVVVVCKPHPSCEQVYWDMYNEARAILDNAIDAQGRKLEVHDIEEPDPALVKGDVPGEEDAPAASYVNFYFVNGGLVIPAFGDPEPDRKAFELLQKLVPEREVRQVAVNALPRTGGVLHCTTQQVL
jgi:agmatine deiminase